MDTTLNDCATITMRFSCGVKMVIDNLGFQSLEVMLQEDVEFMIDLMDTLE